MAILYEGEGDLFKCGERCLVIPVNTSYAMGAGIALYVKKRWPYIFEQYKERLRNKTLDIGKPIEIGTYDGYRLILFPTKAKWKDPSRLEYIEQGLKALKERDKVYADCVLVFPPLGCGYGNLDYVKQVGPLMREELKDAPFDSVILFPPD